MSELEIEPITKDEFPLYDGGFKEGGLGDNIAKLAIDSGFKVKCRWSHNGVTKICSATPNSHKVASHLGIKVNTTCRGGTFYIIRIE